jgi:hypothetical protein
MKKLMLLFAVLAVVALAPATSDIFHDRPDPEATGGIAGRIVGDEVRLHEVIAIEQVAYMFYQGQVGANNTYSFHNLPPGKYDLLLRLKDAIIEGWRLDVWGETEELPKEDYLAIKKLIEISDDFYPHKKIVRGGGTRETQKLLVEQVRTEKTLNPDGSLQHGMLRRIDYTVVTKTREVWQIEKSRHALRENPPHGSVVRWHYNPKLGGIRVGDEIVVVEDVELNNNKGE